MIYCTENSTYSRELEDTWCRCILTSRFSCSICLRKCWTCCPYAFCPNIIIERFHSKRKQFLRNPYTAVFCVGNMITPTMHFGSKAPSDLANLYSSHGNLARSALKTRASLKLMNSPPYKFYPCQEMPEIVLQSGNE